MSQKDSNDSIVESDEIELSSDDYASDLETEKLGNSAWADVMGKLLHSNVSRDNVILNKSKKDTDKKLKEKEKFVIDDESGKMSNLRNDGAEVDAKSYKEKRNETMKKQNQIGPIHKELSLNQEDSNDSIIMEEDDIDMLSEESGNILETENLGNTAWADAMCKVLNTNVCKDKNFILSKAKKDKDVKIKKKKEIEFVDESGNVLNLKNTDAEQKKARSYKEKRKEMIEKQKQKAAWESMCRVKPSITDKDREREFVCIATRGVVHLFNTVEKHQKTLKDSKVKKLKKKESLGAVKGSFMDILKGRSNKELTSENDPVLIKVKHEETWNILKDDFMLGAEMKDWDKESDN